MELKEMTEAFFADFGKGRMMVLSTTDGSKVSSRMMSVVLIGDRFYFQTDKMLRKYSQLKADHNVALCTDNIQIEGVCEELGHPLSYKEFCKAFEDCYKGSYDAYTSLENERLFEVTPHFIERWTYKDGVPFIETFDLINGSYGLEEYKGI